MNEKIGFSSIDNPSVQPSISYPDLKRDLELFTQTLKNQIDSTHEIQTIIYRTLIADLAEQLRFDAAKHSKHVDEVLEVFAIERGMLSDDALSLQPVDIIQGDGDVIQLILEGKTDEGQVLISSTPTGIVCVLGKERLPRDIELMLVGKSCGDKFTLPILYSDTAIDQFAGKTVHYSVEKLGYMARLFALWRFLRRHKAKRRH